MWGGRKGELMFTGFRVSDVQEEDVLELFFTTVRIYVTLWNCAFQNGEVDKYYVTPPFLTTIKKKTNTGSLSQPIKPDQAFFPSM